MTWPDGRKYIGHFENGKPQGHGKRVDAYGNSQVGNY
jgi:hypothetical protein